MDNLIEIEIPELGVVTLKKIVKFGMVSDAYEFAEQLGSDEEANAFVNFLLSSMFVKPEMNPENIAELPDDAVVELVAVAADLLGIREEFDNSPEDLQIRERLYHAYTEKLKDVFDAFAKAIAPITDSFDRIAKNISDILAPSYKFENIFNTNALGSLVDNSRLQDIISSLGSFKPILPDVLKATEINLPLLHSPTYIFPEVYLPEKEENIEEYTEQTDRRILVDAYDIIMQLERSLRELIEAKLREIYSDAWWRQGVPGTVLLECKERKQDKEKGVNQYHPINYAYFNNYKDIIVRRDNWDGVFAKIFGNKIQLEACFTWVANVRDSVAHSRNLSEEEYTELAFGADWLQKRINQAMEGYEE